MLKPDLCFGMSQMRQSLCRPNQTPSHGQDNGARNIRQRCQNHIVSRHYTRPDHDGTQNMIIHILEFIPAHPDSKAAADLRNRSGASKIKS